jgi:Flp pilus assembly pilin Flp
VVGSVSTGLTARDGKQDLNEETRGGGEGMSDWVWGLAARFRKEEGQALAEYSLILALVFIACVIALGFLGLAIAGRLSALADALP